MLLAPINCGVKCTCCCSSLDQNKQHTTHILQPLNTSLAAASFECWGLDCHFSWQRHPSSHLCYHLAPANSPGPLCVTRTATADQTDWLQGLEKAKPYCWSTQEEGNLSGRSSSGHAELLLLPLPCLRLKQFSWEFYYNFITTSCPSHTTQPKKSGTGIRNLESKVFWSLNLEILFSFSIHLQ